MNGSTRKLSLNIPNFGTPAEGLCTGGQPQPDQLREAQQAGVHTIINLRPIAEHADFDEASLVASLGMTYVNIPIAGPADLTRDNAHKLADALEVAGNGPTLVHCASANRVGALFALKAHYLDGMDVESALALGRNAGLKAMEPLVRELLSS